MGLIKAALGAAGGMLAAQWKEMIYCESIPADVLTVKGQKRVGGRSSNTKASDNIITNGSAVVVNDGQCMVIVEQGKVVEVCAEPGEFIYDNQVAPSVFSGDLGQSLADTFAQIGKRLTFGGDTGTDQRVYYFNTKEVMGNKYGTATPVPFRVVDANIGLDVDISVRCNGEYSYRICNPILFYTNVCGNVESEYRRAEIDSQLKSELLTALQPAFAKISAAGVRYSAVPAHTQELADALNEALSSKWRELRGIEVVSFGVNSIATSPEDEQMIKDLQKAATMRDPSMRDAVLAAAQGDAMRTAAGNEGGMGAMGAFIGMGMAGQMGRPAGGSYSNAAPNPPQSQYATAAGGGFAPAPAPQQPGGWTCSSCGASGNMGKFCNDCGSPRPADAGTWACASCGTAGNTGKFCRECGTPAPTSQPRYKCDKCGWVPEDQSRPPKFCPECGDVFDEGDLS